MWHGLAPAPEEAPTEPPAEAESPAEGEAKREAKHAETPEKEKPGKPTGEGPSGKSDVTLPNVEIQGELEKPDIFFVIPRAKDASDEELMRAAFGARSLDPSSRIGSRRRCFSSE